MHTSSFIFQFDFIFSIFLPVSGPTYTTTYIGPSAMMPNLTQAFMHQYANMQPMLGLMGGIRPVGRMGQGTPSNMQLILGLQGETDKLSKYEQVYNISIIYSYSV